MRHFAALTLALAALATPAAAMTIDDVLQLLQAGVNESVILDQVEAEGARFRLETEDILALKNWGASDHLVRSLIATSDRSVDRSRTDDGGSWSDDYYSNDYYARDSRSRTSVSLSFTYDPFGYYWYCSPYYYGYYYPFRTINFGWYYAGCLSRSWWGWYAYWPTYYRDYCAYWYPHSYHHHGHHDYDGPRSRTRHAYVDRDQDRYRDRDGRAYTRDTSRGSGSIDRTRTPRATERQRDPAAVGRSPDRDRERGRAWSDRGGSRERAPEADRAPRSTGRGEVREPRQSSPPDRSAPAPAPRTRGGGDSSGGSRRWGR